MNIFQMIIACLCAQTSFANEPNDKQPKQLTPQERQEQAKMQHTIGAITMQVRRAQQKQALKMLAVKAGKARL